LNAEAPAGMTWLSTQVCTSVQLFQFPVGLQTLGRLVASSWAARAVVGLLHPKGTNAPAGMAPKTEGPFSLLLSGYHLLAWG